MTAPTLDCDAVVRELWDFLDGELDERRWQMIRDHLAHCTGCTAHVDFARSFLARVGSLPSDASDLERLRTTVQRAMQTARST